MINNFVLIPNFKFTAMEGSEEFVDKTLSRLRKSGGGSFLFTQKLVQAAKQHA
jgi:hypothetical protein